MSWCQHTKTLLHLSISLVRSKLIYGKEVYFSAPNTLLKKMQSIDSKAIKLAIGVPMHTNKRVVSYVQKLYQSEMTKLTAYIKENGFELSQEKTCLMLFNNGENPKSLPQIDDELMLNVLRCHLTY